MEKSECDTWLEAAKQVLKEAGVPMHYLEIKRVILQKQLVSKGLQSTLESALQEDSERKISERLIFSVDGQPGYFMFMKEEIKLSEETSSPKTYQKSQTKGKTVNETKSKGKGQAETKPKVMNETKSKGKGQTETKPKVKVKLKIENEEKIQGKDDKTDINITGKEKSSKKLTTDQECDKNSVNNKYEKKYRKLRRYAKDLIFLNAAYCDEVIYTEEQISKATAERKYLLNRLLHHRSAAVNQTTKDTPTSGGNSKTASLSKSQSIAQILNSMEKKSKKKAANNKSGTKNAKQVQEDGKTSKVKKSPKLSSDCKPKVLDSVTIDITPQNQALPMDVG